mgnify:CR=1 FL=1
MALPVAGGNCLLTDAAGPELIDRLFAEAYAVNVIRHDNIVDVLDAQRQLYSSVRNYNDARYDYILNNLRLKQAAGTLAPSDLEALSRFLKPDYDPDRDFLPQDLAKAAEAQLKGNSNF